MNDWSSIFCLVNATLVSVQLNVNDIFLAIAKKLPKDGEGGAAGAGGIRWEQLEKSEFWNRVISSDFQAWAWSRWECSQELLLQQITLVWLLKSGLKLQKGNCEKRFWIRSTAGVRLKVTLRSLWLFTVIRKWLLKQQLAWSSLHAREHSTDLFTLFYSCPSHNHLGLLYVYLTNATSFMNSTTLPLKYRVHWVYISTWEVFEHFQDQCHLFYICWKHELCVIYY